MHSLLKLKNDENASQPHAITQAKPLAPLCMSSYSSLPTKPKK